MQSLSFICNKDKGPISRDPFYAASSCLLFTRHDMYVDVALQCK